MSNSSLKCHHQDLLALFLSKLPATLNDKLPSGQRQYTFANGLVVNLYETATVTFQGKETDSQLASLIYEYIDLVNQIKEFS